MAATSVSFGVKLTTKDDLDLIEAMEIVQSMCDRLSGPFTLSDGRTVILTAEVNPEPMEESQDPVDAFRAGAEEAQGAALRPGLLSDRQFGRNQSSEGPSSPAG